jgi:L-threonylcarbamoyladenylate synthase
VSYRFDCADPAARGRGIERAAAQIQDGHLVVLPTEAVYGIACDPFNGSAIEALTEARRASRGPLPPLLVPRTRSLDGLAADLSEGGRKLAEAFWPGRLTLLCRPRPVLEHYTTEGTVGLRMPLHPVALALLRRTGPLAVTGACRRGRPPRRDCDGAQDEFAGTEILYLDAGPTGDGEVSTVVDVTGPRPEVLRSGAVTVRQLREVAPLIDGPETEQ